ncbi:BURP domain-containing protein 5-like [Nymphaea colorata]|nr:BURP domain-containing protein 5-like [Nymphaea colorata]
MGGACEALGQNLALAEMETEAPSRAPPTGDISLSVSGVDLIDWIDQPPSFSAFQLVVATNDGSSTINSYWNEVFPRTPMPNAIRALLPSSPEISGFSRGLHHYDQVETPLYPQPWGRRWGVLGNDHDQFKSNWSPNLAPLYFLRDDLQPGSKMNVTIMISPTIIDALSQPSCHANELKQFPSRPPISLPSLILKMFSIQPHSEHASLTSQTLADCEMPALKGEVKYCATSLESMIDFVVAELGSREIHTVVTSVVNKEEKVKARTYRVGDGGGKVISSKVVACHDVMFPYVVFYCHIFPGTRPYMVPLIADDGSQVNAIALCHFDTSKWNPGHASFQLLGVKPGTVPICHFIVKDLAWVPN